MEIKTMFEIVKEYYIGKLVNVCLLTDLVSNEIFITELPKTLNSNKLIKRELIELKVIDVIYQVYCEFSWYYLIFKYNNKEYKIELCVI